MKIDFATTMSRALEQIRAGHPGDATRTIQAALSARAEPRPEPPANRPPLTGPPVEEAEVIAERAPGPAPAGPPARRGLREVVDALARIRPGTPQPGRAPRPRPPIPEGARLETRSFASRHGARDYLLYVPASAPQGARGLVLMLHGCTQDPDDFAAGSRMNAEAERHGLVVAYPHQTRQHNAQGCWNWFRPGDQREDGGEAALLAALAQEVARDFGVTEGRIFVAGLSAGGAMAATLAATHPQLFAAAGVHSGLPHGAAHDVISAFAAMRGERARATVAARQPVRTIIFHGLADTTVHPSNAEALLAATGATAQGARRQERGRTPAGRSWSRETVTGEDGRSLAELWRIEGAGHAWAGGCASGSYTDPAGPDASAEMVRFFLEGS
ncbi:extracellular catalytic domain type 1 short-chain-length polyhydroxyalkanoate depolymerase [Cereibacter azotoformans]|uniref:Poly(Hydroxyalkanoate) depolymerase family esterase n=1 Tax=Cereibacter azotoformans TaxID=43057 RepID=A0A2T5JVQ9_9RHOB|nr:PHB depolymerase family esterase [Cereibacter azotoformans]PTR14255.1 poly(hydroxyalkanoate) depolymerase family esterase [Cereibacter azotoformans]